MQSIVYNFLDDIAWYVLALVWKNEDRRCEQNFSVFHVFSLVRSIMDREDITICDILEVRKGRICFHRTRHCDALRCAEQRKSSDREYPDLISPVTTWWRRFEVELRLQHRKKLLSLRCFKQFLKYLKKSSFFFKINVTFFDFRDFYIRDRLIGCLWFWTCRRRQDWSMRLHKATKQPAGLYLIKQTTRWDFFLAAFYRNFIWYRTRWSDE